MPRAGPLSSLLGVSPRLADRAAPAAFCCAFEVAGIGFLRLAHRKEPAGELAVPSGYRAALTLHTVFPTSSATSSAPSRAISTPTGRPNALSPARKPVRTSIGWPLGRPFANGTNTTL